MNDEMQRTMQFILEQQAQFTVNQQKAEERVTKIEENLVELTQAQTSLARAQTHINGVVAAMLETHKHTEEKLEAFIGVLERYISLRQNGGANEGDAR